MSRRELWKLGLRNVLSAPLRSVLTVLGLAIGIGAILAVLTLGDAGQAQVRTEMGRLGIDKVWLTSDEHGSLRLGDGTWISEHTGYESTELIYFPTEVYSHQQKGEVTVVGCDEEYLLQSGITILEGRMPYSLEWRAPSRMALLGHHLAQKLEIVSGDTIYVENQPLVVCAIIDAGDEFSRFELAESLLLPLEMLSQMNNGQIHEVMLSVPASTMPQEAAAMAQELLRQQKGVEVSAMTMQVQLDAANSVIHTFVQVLKWVAFICMAVGGVGVMNILLVGVRERRREIGIMQSLGTTRKQICWLFLLEALMYASAGGIIGILVGVGIVQIAGNSIGLIASIRLKDCLIVLLSAMVIGLFFGVAPASQASKMKPVDALRTN